MAWTIAQYVYLVLLTTGDPECIYFEEDDDG